MPYRIPSTKSLTFDTTFKIIARIKNIIPTGTYLFDFIRSCSLNNQQRYIIFRTIQLPIF